MHCSRTQREPVRRLAPWRLRTRLAGSRPRIAALSLRPVATLALALLVTGCGLADAPMISPKGPITLAERDLLFTAFALMMIVAVPVFVLTALFAVRYRASNTASTYRPRWTGNWQLEAVIWLVPAAIVVTLAVLLWNATQRLDPYKELASTAPPMKVQAIAQNWKWLFVYPELGIATVNEVAFPADRPVSFEITSDTVMNSFMIPALGGQIYAMAGMRTELNLVADAPGTFTGRNTMFSGEGYPDQHFQAHAMSDTDFDAWVDKVKADGTALDARTYVELVKPSIANPVAYYSSVEPDLFSIVLSKYQPYDGRPESLASAIICGRAT